MIFDDLWRAQRERRRLGRRFDPLIAKVTKEKRWEERESLLGELIMEMDMIHDKINWVETRRVQERAEILGIPTPPVTDKEA